MNHSKRTAPQLSLDVDQVPPFTHTYSSFLRVERCDHGEIDVEMRQIVATLITYNQHTGDPILDVKALVEILQKMQQLVPPQQDEEHQSTTQSTFSLCQPKSQPKLKKSTASTKVKPNKYQKQYPGVKNRFSLFEDDEGDIAGISKSSSTKSASSKPIESLPILPPCENTDARRIRRLMINLPWVILYQLHLHIMSCNDSYRPSCSLPILHTIEYHEWSSLLDSRVMNECMKREELQTRRRKLIRRQQHDDVSITISPPVGVSTLDIASNGMTNNDSSNKHDILTNRSPRWWLKASGLDEHWSKWHEPTHPLDGNISPRFPCDYVPCLHLDTGHYLERAHPSLRAPMELDGDKIAIETDLCKAPLYRADHLFTQSHIDSSSTHGLRLALYPHRGKLHPSFRQHRMTLSETHHPFVDHRNFMPRADRLPHGGGRGGRGGGRGGRGGGVVNSIRGFPFKEGAPSAQKTLARFRRNLHGFLGFDPAHLLLNAGCQIMGGAVLACALPLHTSLTQYHRNVERYEELFQHPSFAVLPTVIVSSILSFCTEYQSAYHECVTAMNQYYRSVASGVSQSDVDIFLYSQLTLSDNCKNVDADDTTPSLCQLMDDRISHMVAHLHSSIGSHRYPYVVRSKTAFTLCGCEKFRNIQFVPVIGRGPVDVLMDSDVDCASMSYDGKQVWCLPRAQAAINSRCNLTSPFLLRYHRFRARVAKYVLRSFDTIVFESCKHEPRCDEVLDTDVYLMFAKLVVHLRAQREAAEKTEREMYFNRFRSDDIPDDYMKLVPVDDDASSPNEDDDFNKVVQEETREPNINDIRRHYGVHRFVHAPVGTPMASDIRSASFASSLLVQQMCSNRDEETKLKRYQSSIPELKTEVDSQQSLLIERRTLTRERAMSGFQKVKQDEVEEKGEEVEKKEDRDSQLIISGDHLTDDLFDNDHLIYKDDTSNIIPTFSPNVEFLRRFFLFREAEEKSTRSTRFVHDFACHFPAFIKKQRAFGYDKHFGHEQSTTHQTSSSTIGRTNDHNGNNLTALSVAPFIPSSNSLFDAAPEIGVDVSRVSHYCYMCRELTDGEYGDLFCQRCESVNRHYRELMGRVSLSGLVCIVTGARIKIGFSTALQLLRNGATVIVTTRFPYLALARYHCQHDCATWLNRLYVCALDLRHLTSIHTFVNEVKRRFSRVDILINNAAQTVKKSPECTTYWSELERCCYQIYQQNQSQSEPPPSSRKLKQKQQQQSNSQHQVQHAMTLQKFAVMEQSAEPTLIAWTNSQETFDDLLGHFDIGRHQPTQSRNTKQSDNSALIRTRGELRDVISSKQDSDGIDIRKVTSWSATITDIATEELLEVTAINQVAPFLLIQSLIPLMTSPSRRDGAFIINVTSPEGNFSPFRQMDIHPHTNMCKAALNQLTMTSAPLLSSNHRIFLLAVDPGWCSEQRSLPRVVHHPIKIPLSYQDGAARILQPIVEWKVEHENSPQTQLVTTEQPTQKLPPLPSPPQTGILLKDFRPATW